MTERRNLTDQNLGSGSRRTLLLDTRTLAAIEGHGADVGGALVARNALWLVVGQMVTAALSFAVAALLARHLGAEGYGVFYLAGAFVETAFVFVECGQDYSIVRAVARHREGLGDLLGTGLALRVVTAFVIYWPIAGVAALLNYSAATRTAIALMVVFYLLSSLGNGFSVIFRGLERMDCEAAARVAFKALIAVSVVVAVELGGGLSAVIEAQALGAAAALAIYVMIARRLGIPPLEVRGRTAGVILRESAPFLLWNLVMTSDASIHAVMLSTLAPGDVVGWYAAATRLSGILIVPATILAAALYPTLSRLFVERPQGYRSFARSGLRSMLLLGGLAAGGTLLFADQAVALVYGRQAFGPAATILRVLSLNIFLDFMNITLGAAIMAANRQAPFIYAKACCILLVIALNSALIPLCQVQFGNGGIGSSITAATTELVMLSAAFLFIPRGTLAANLLRDLGRVIAAMAVMAGATWLLANILPGITIIAAVLAYLAAVVLLGGFSRDDIALLREAVHIRSRAALAGGS